MIIYELVHLAILSFSPPDMSVNASASSNDFLFLSFNSHLPFGLNCLIGKPICFVFTSYISINFLFLLPLCILVLYHGLQRRRQQRSSSTASMTSHSDSFTYHLIAMEIIYVFGCILCCFGIYMIQLQVLRVGIHLFALSWYGEAFFHVLTCLEHYLAVVHPIIYLSMRQERWIRIRNICIGCIWLLCIGGSILVTLDTICIILMFCLLISSLIIISFCCLSVLCVLMHPGPGKQGKDRGRVDQSKQRAFYTIVVILGVLFLRCAWNLIWAMLYVLNVGINICVVVMCDLWINLPSNLVLPLLFLQRAGMLACCKNNTK